MREILFRGKTYSGEWVQGDLFEVFDDGFFIHDKRCHSVKIIPETVGQYTDLTDKYGKKIFEGDIVKIAYCFGWDDEQEKNVPEEEYISKVYSIDGCPFCVDLLHCDGDMSPIAWLDWSYDDAEIEVIGNIFDNPELMKGAE